MVQVDRGEHLSSGEWLNLNRAHWESREPGSPDPLLAATPASDEEAGVRVLHLQSGDGSRSLVHARRGAEVIGVDFSMPVVRRARALAEDLGLSDRSRFLCANVYELRHMLPEPDSFGLVVTSRSAVSWLPDLDEWARIIEWFVEPGGSFVLDPDAGEGVVDADVRRVDHSLRSLAEALERAGLEVGPPADDESIVATKRV
ncbi:methyltransferase domain-containing protein [Rathayibacter sp. VKM Ac-2803]|uniref:class I SAM-dependent methyltransferase n=1 Tax=unclassified Rathayibacter TaxID=2609250 RepID=UPI001359EC51|nr:MULTISPECIES: methyltransferase domain-containing protein [unclassified Rathayibacter]MWV49362.1 methyltransferase domain-containing protein [Rathayibacter sp. VKM Ac-2803]MWV59887.1 methyltransferase domain-containing protein [Rathayibacter sp. VKM Ac-2754]